MKEVIDGVCVNCGQVSNKVFVARVTAKLEAGGASVKCSLFRDVAENMIGLPVSRLRELEEVAVSMRDGKREKLRMEVVFNTEWEVRIKFRSSRVEGDGGAEPELWHNLTAQSATNVAKRTRVS